MRLAGIKGQTKRPLWLKEQGRRERCLFRQGRAAGLDQAGPSGHGKKFEISNKFTEKTLENSSHWSDVVCFAFENNHPAYCLKN